MKGAGIFVALIFVMLSVGNALACEVCKKNQPEVLQDISHGTGAQANLEYIIIWSAVVIVAITLYFSAKFLIRPNEGNRGHIKNIVVDKL